MKNFYVNGQFVSFYYASTQTEEERENAPEERCVSIGRFGAFQTEEPVKRPGWK